MLRSDGVTVSQCDKHYNMDIYEARIKIHTAITETLVALGTDNKTTDEELQSLSDECAEIADIIMEDLGISVVSIGEDGKTIHATIELYEPE